MPEGWGPVTQDTTPADWNPIDVIEQEPYAPTEVKVLRAGTATIKVTWRDPAARQPGFRRFSESPFGSWSIRYTSQEVAGHSAGNAAWARFVLDASREIGSRPSGHTGVLQFLYTDTEIRNGWIIVVGITDSGSQGPPSTPVWAAFENTSVPAPPSVQLAAGNMAVIANPSMPSTEPLMQIILLYTPPTDTSGFLGVHPHMRGYNGSSDLIEIGFHHWNRTTRDQLYQFWMTADSGAGNMVVTLTNGANTVVRVSGDNFAADMDDNWGYVYTPSTNTYDVIILDTVTPPSNATMLSNWGGLSGNYAMRVFNELSLFMVPVSTSGTRTADPESEVEVQFGV